MEHLNDDVILKIFQMLPSLEQIKLVSFRFKDIVDYMREKNLTLSTQESLLKVDYLLRQNTSFPFLYENEFIWRSCSFLEEIGVYHGTTQTVLGNDQVNSELNYCIASVFGTTLMILKDESLFQHHDESMEAIYNLTTLLRTMTNVKNWDKTKKTLRWESYEINLSNLSSIQVSTNNEKPENSLKNDDNNNFFPNRKRLIKDFHGSKTVLNGSFYQVIPFPKLNVYEENGTSVVSEFPDGSVLIKKLMNRYALISIQESEEKFIMCCYDIDSDSMNETMETLFTYDPKNKPEVFVLKNDHTVLIKCSVSWYEIIIGDDHRIHSKVIVGHSDDYPIFCPVTGIFWIKSTWFMMDKNRSFERSKFKLLGVTCCLC